MSLLRAPLRSLLFALAGLVLTAPFPCAAQLKIDVVPATAAPLAHQRALPAAAAPSLPSSTARTLSTPFASDSTWLGTAIQLEAPRSVNGGAYTRPKFHVGVPSESMRGLLNSAGFAAEKCQLPMVRARTKSSGDGDVNGTLWLYARCTFY